MRYFKSSTVGCPQCGRQVLKHRDTCPRCGTDLPKALPKPSVSKPQPDPAIDQRPILPIAKPGYAFVYLISDGEYCKIGFAEDLTRRLSLLQHATARPLLVQLHGLFGKKHIRREWYQGISTEEWNAELSRAMVQLDHNL